MSDREISIANITILIGKREIVLTPTEARDLQQRLNALLNYYVPSYPIVPYYYHYSLPVRAAVSGDVVEIK